MAPGRLMYAVQGTGLDMRQEDSLCLHIRILIS